MLKSRNHRIPVMMAKQQMTADSGVNKGKGSTSVTAVGVQTGSHYGNQCGGSQKDENGS